MTWKDLGELDKARREGQREIGTLYGAALHLQGVKSLTNAQFLEQLVLEHKIDSSRANECLRIIGEYGSTLSPATLKDYRRVLLYSSLPETYAYLDIAALLTRTKQLSDSTTAPGRIQKTGRITQALIEGMAAPDKTGLLTALTDLGERHRKLGVAHRSAGEFPYINQVGLAYTLLTFSYTPFVAIERGGRTIPKPAARTSWLHMWNIVGSLMGIEDGGLPATLGEAEQLLDLIRTSPGYGPSDAGTELMLALKTIVGAAKEKGFTRYADAALLKLLAF
jgi:hypothetical protein